MATPRTSPLAARADKKPKLFLIDAYAYLFRAYHALPPLATSKGVPTGATYGFLTAMLKVFREQKPGWVAVVWDAPGKSFRDELYADYKANREGPPEDLRPQFEQVRRITDALLIPTIEAKGFEADDVIATLTRQAVEQGIEVAVVSGDKDLMCLVHDPQVVVLDLVRYKTYDRAGVLAKFGVPPESMADFLSLVGDAGDNVPGVAGVGEKTAADLLTRYGSVEKILAELSHLEPDRVRKKLEASRADLELSRKLVKLDDHVPLQFDQAALAIRQPDADKIRPLLLEMEFHRLIPQFASATEVKRAISRAGYKSVLDEAGLQAMVEAAQASPRVSLDLQTEGGSPFDTRLVGLSIATDPDHAFYVPFAHSYLGVPGQLKIERVLEALKPLLSDPTRPKVVQSSKYDFLVLERYGVAVEGFVSDPMIAAYVGNPDRQVQGVAELALDVLEHKVVDLEATIGRVSGPGRAAIKSLAGVPVEQATQVAAEEAQVSLLLAERLEKHLEESPALVRLYRELETPLVQVLMDMEKAGITIDVPFLQKLSVEYESTLKAAEKAVHEAAGMDFNIGSPIQLRQVLFERLKLPVIKRTKTGASTDEDVLEKLADRHPVPKLILDYRSKAKLKSTYIDAIPRLVRSDGRVHTTFNQTVATTGRLSSSDPNLQNIPIRTEEGRKIRRAFVAAPGCQLLSADYSQIELRVVAALSGEPAMKEAFARGEDIHRATARAVFGTDDDEHRARSKAINFGIIYGLTKHGLVSNIGGTKDDAQKFIDAYFEKYPRIRAYLDDSLAHTLKWGYAETKFGRRRPFPDVLSKNPMLREAARRAAINHPVQGTAADLMKMAMLAAHKRLRQENLRARMLLQIHDELVFEAPQAEVERVTALAKETMEGVADIGVPLKVEVGVGANWDEV